MYKWPEGRVIRIVCFIVAAVIATDIGWNAARADIFNYLGDPKLPILLRGIFYSLAALAVVVFALVAVGFKPASVDFLIEVEQEMLKVEWPTKNLVRNTFIIAIVIVVVAGLIFLVNSALFALLVEGVKTMGGWL